MTLTYAGADIRGYYNSLGIAIPGWTHSNASVRCFANPDTHQRADKNPSCSINLQHGAWHCHGCGSKGGAYDAALTRGYTPRDAIDLMVAFGLTEHRAHRRTDLKRSSVAASRTSSKRRPIGQRTASEAPFSITEEEIAFWHTNLAGAGSLMDRLTRTRAWNLATIRELGLGVDRGQITIPTRDQDGRLNGLLRYRPWPKSGEAKLIAAAGSRRSLLPHPTVETSHSLLLVEGEADMIAARSAGLPAIAIPGANSWRSEWAPLLRGHEITIVTDADEQGRSLAREISHDLAGIADATVLDLAPERNDGYDLTDWLLEQ